jgi:hypothetical protein
MLAQKEAMNKEMMASICKLAKMYMQHNSLDPTAFTAELLAQLSLSNTSGDSSKEPSVAVAAAAAAGRKKKPTLTVNTGFGGGGMSTTGELTTANSLNKFSSCCLYSPVKSVVMSLSVKTLRVLHCIKRVLSCCVVNTMLLLQRLTQSRITKHTHTHYR